MKAHFEYVENEFKRSNLNELNAVCIASGFTPLVAACLKGDLSEVGLLLSFSADPAAECDVVDTKNGLGAILKEFPLSIAAREGHEAIVKMLLTHEGVDLNQVTSDTGSSALYTACIMGKSNVCEVLLRQRKIDVNKATNYDIDSEIDSVPLHIAPLHIACDLGHTEVATMLLAHDRIDVNKPNSEGSTSLSLACECGHAEIIKSLLAHSRIDVNKPDLSFGQTPLTLVCQNGHTDGLRLLLADGRADIHTADGDGFTLLHTAGIEGHLLTAQIVVIHGASLTAVNDDGLTPVEYAESQGNEHLLTAYEELAVWLNSIAAWSQLRVAAGCRLYKDAAVALRHGRIDPDDPAKTSIKAIMAVIATAKAEPAALPWQDAPPICKSTIKLVCDATHGWSRTSHWLHHGKVREAVFAVLVVGLRVERRAALLAETAADEADAYATAVLPSEMWIFMMRFFMRSWWKV